MVVERDARPPPDEQARASFPSLVTIQPQVCHPAQLRPPDHPGHPGAGWQRHHLAEGDPDGELKTGGKTGRCHHRGAERSVLDADGGGRYSQVQLEHQPQWGGDHSDRGQVTFACIGFFT